MCVCLLARRPYIVSVLHLSRDYDFVLCALHFDWQLAVGNTLSEVCCVSLLAMQNILSAACRGSHSLLISISLH